jgi:hypothetical protein
LHQSEFDFNPESTFEIQVLQEKRKSYFSLRSLSTSSQLMSW